MAKPFHAAILVDDLDAAREFYGALLGCPEGRSDSDWVDFDLFGNQLVCHRGPGHAGGTEQSNSVDGKSVPVPHWGVVLGISEWRTLADRLTDAGVDFLIKPYIRFSGEVGEQGTFFIADASGNALEFKGFADQNQLFAS